jgi:hypothetical protein
MCIPRWHFHIPNERMCLKKKQIWRAKSPPNAHALTDIHACIHSYTHTLIYIYIYIYIYSQRAWLNRRTKTKMNCKPAVDARHFFSSSMETSLTGCHAKASRRNNTCGVCRYWKYTNTCINGHTYSMYALTFLFESDIPIQMSCRAYNV